MYEELVARLHRAADTSDLDLVLSDDALREAEALLAADSEEIEKHPAWLVAVGMLHWFRFQALNARELDGSAVELRNAFLMFGSVRDVMPQWTPPEFGQAFDAVDAGTKGQADPFMLYGYGQALLSVAQDRVTIGQAITALQLAREGTPREHPTRRTIMSELTTAFLWQEQLP